MDFPASPIAALLAETGRPAMPALPAPAAYAPLCCAPTAAPAPAPSRRLRLHELTAHIHCSVIGTCLSTHELRRLVPRYVDIDRKEATDLEIHHAAVELAAGGPGAKALNKALDARYEAVIRRFQQAKTADELGACWDECLRQGDVPGAYWALMTHPRTTGNLRQKAFGEVHMLSHLVGAANRADIRRLVALEADNGELKETVQRQQLRLRNMALQLQAEQRRAVDAERAACRPGPDVSDVLLELRRRIDALGSDLACRDQEIAHQTRRREDAEQQYAELQRRHAALHDRVGRSDRTVEDLGQELRALEATLTRRLAADDDDDRISGFLKDKRIVQVGGRPSSNRALRALVEAAGGQLVTHDGGIEDRKGLLATVLPGADFVVFPVDCIDHDSMLQVKRLCERHGIAFHPLRSASVASFLALIARLARPVPEATAARTRMCLRHG